MAAERVRAIVERELGLEIADGDALETAIQTRLAERRLSVARYADALDDPRELQALGQLLTVGETYFFRMRAHLDVLRSFVATTADRPPLVLSAGCSTGEEAYSVAVALRTAGHPDARVIGIDLNQRSLDVARAATYSDWSLRSVAAADRDRWFERSGQRWTVRAEIRAMVQLRAGNLLDDGAVPAGPFDAIFCRNVIMYFTRDAARSAIERLTASLRAGGLLFLGHAETLRGLSEAYAVQQSGDLFHYRHRHPSSPPPPPVASHTTRATPWLEPPPAPSPVVAPDVMALVADERFEDALSAMGPEPSVLRAVTLLNLGRIRDAEDVCTELLAREEGGAEAHYVLGLAAESRGDRPGAIDRHRAVLYLEPDFALAHLQLGRLERREGDRDRARRDLRHALELLTHEKAARLALFGGGFDREGLIALGRAELAAL